MPYFKKIFMKGHDPSKRFLENFILFVYLFPREYIVGIMGEAGFRQVCIAAHALQPTRGNKCLCERRPFNGDKAVLAPIQGTSDRSPDPGQMALHSPSANSDLGKSLRYSIRWTFSA